MRAVTYAAKSTADIHGSIPTQLADGRKLAADRDFEVVAEFQDESASAYHGDRGPGLAKALAECERLSAEHGSCALIVQHSDRLARGDAKQARHLIELVVWAIKHDVQLLSVQDPEMLAGGEMGLLMGVIGGMRNHQDSKRKGLAVRDGMKRRAERGEWVGGHPPYGYKSAGRYEPLVVVPAQAAVVLRIFAEYSTGRGQRGIVRALNADGIPTATGKQWLQSAITRLLANIAYTGRLLAKDDEGNRTRVLDGAHPAIVDDELWARVQTVRTIGSRRKGGRHADGGHLLVRGVLRCTCGSAMIPRKARPGVNRAVYACRGRIEHGADFCSQPSIRRERIDEPLLATLLDSYIDLDATRQRIEERASSALTVARQALEQAERDAATAEAKLARVRGHYQAGKIEADDWSEQRPQLTAELDAAREAAQRTREHVQAVEQGGVPGDAEQALLDHLARLKRAVGEGVGAAPDLHALRNTIGDLFESVTLVRSGTWPQDVGDGMIPWHHDVPAVADGPVRYWLLLSLRSSVVDSETLRPIGQAIPVPVKQSYPDTLLARYCWW
jgi:site-specific DNA recombinase